MPVPLRVAHAAFRGVDRRGAAQLLEGAPAGDYLLHPSEAAHPAHLPGRLTLTWKVAEGVLQHLPLGEGAGGVLVLPAVLDAPPATDCYEDVEEIVARRIEPIVSLLQEARACPKFFNCLRGGAGAGAVDALDAARHRITAHLRHVHAANPARTPYCLSLAPAPLAGHLLLGHLGGRRRVEVVRVDPRGFALQPPGAGRALLFDRVDRLVDYFKAHYRDFCRDDRDVSGAGASASASASGSTSKYTQFADDQ